MGTAYAKVHLFFTIPLATVLWQAFRRIRTDRDVFLTKAFIIFAFVATIPWDSYLIRTRVWTYPDDATLGVTLFSIPVEEHFFFFIQTYITSQIYLILSKPVLHVAKLSRSTNYALQLVGGLVLAAACSAGIALIWLGGPGTYLGLILTWTCPFLLFIWVIAASHIVSLPLSAVALPIAIPTVYLWLVDTFSLHRGTWSITSGTKLGLYLWPSLEIEEAVFFLLTNVMLVCGLAAGHKAFAICDLLNWEAQYNVQTVPQLLRALLVPRSEWPEKRIRAVDMAYETLANKEHGKSFMAASLLFEGRQRIGLLQLYAFCRICDDLIDNATTEKEMNLAAKSIEKVVSSKEKLTSRPSEQDDALRVLYAFVADYNIQPFVAQLLAGFRTDGMFLTKHWPIKTNADLLLYSQQVAGAVAAMCVHMVFPGVPKDPDAQFSVSFEDDRDLEEGGAPSRSNSLLYHAQRVGRALQLINIARDIRTDAKETKRCYIPSKWLFEQSTTPDALVIYLHRRATDSKVPVDNKLERIVRKYQKHLVACAFKMYAQSGPAIARMPSQTRAGMRAAVEQYLELGRVLLEPGNERAMRVRVPKPRRIAVAWKAAGKELISGSASPSVVNTKRI